MESMFLVVMVFALKKGDKIFLEKQALNGIENWAENFDSIDVIFPIIPRIKKYRSMEMVPLDKIKYSDKINVHLLPISYNYFKFLLYVIKNLKLISKLIKKNKYKVFSIGGIAGDWGAIASIISYLKKEKYSVWTDRVEHNVVKTEGEKKSFLKKVYNKYIVYFMMKYYHKYIIKNATIGLFHGFDCFNEYSKYTKKSFLVHDIHFKESDQISKELLEKKLEEVINNKEIKICYIGRISEMKGPMEWLEILKILKENKIKFKAKWFGVGQLKDKMVDKIEKIGLVNEVEMIGFISDKVIIKKELQQSDIFLFCHKTPESPRNLIEALKSACPIIGFHSGYSEDLIKENKGGILIKEFNIKQVAKSIIEIYNDRKKLIELVKKASLDGEKFSDTEVFKHRSDIIKKYS